MILYSNGDSHAAAAEAVNPYVFAEDDPMYVHMQRRPHPDNLEVSYGKLLARVFNTGFATDAEGASSNDRILRTTRDFINNNKSKPFVLIGWTSWERKEVDVDGKMLQLTASGTDSVPEHYKQEYKKWVASCDENHYHKCMKQWHDTIYRFHCELKEQGIKHLFFNAFHQFDKRITGEVNWGDNYVDPYGMTYSDYLASVNITPVSAFSYHYGPDGHNAWARFLIPYIQKII
jgi:hypothetical protein